MANTIKNQMPRTILGKLTCGSGHRLVNPQVVFFDVNRQGWLGPLVRLMTITFVIMAFSGCDSQKNIFIVTDEQGTTDKKGPEVINSINVKVDIQELQNEKLEIVELPIFDNKNLKLVRKRLDRHENGRFAWYGIVENDPGSFALISITPKAIAAKITTSAGEIYTINSIGRGIHRLDQVNDGALPELKNDDIEVPVDTGAIEKDLDCPDPATQIDIMVVYTADAEEAIGGAEGMEAFIYLCIYFTNLSYQNSNANLSMHLVHFERVDYAETGDSGIDLSRLRNTSDGFMDNVHTLRDTHGADLVALITETMSGCGLAYRQYPVTAGFESSAFSVSKRTCAVSIYTFVHETAHNMGGRHDCANSENSAGPNHGHFVSDPADDSGSSWRTVLAYSSCTSGPCSRIPYFSNPNLNYSPTGSTSTDPLGTFAVAESCTNDNTSVLNNAASIVANFRCSSPAVDNVWMKDTWQDTGLEPDPATSGQSMWRSPYIWIRNTARDETFLHQHEHENPRMDVPNWIYVKMHNGGLEDSGNLEIYFADASVSLTWPTAWTLLTTVPVSINAASTRIIEIPWNSLPGEGHYCMLARWTSAADPIGFTETADIGYNVRQSNNIIWRNLNIITLGEDEDEITATFFIQNFTGKPISIKLTDEFLFPKQAFTETGQVFVRLDKGVFADWKKSGSKGVNIEAGENEIEVVGPNASIDDILLNTREKIKASIRFVKNKQTVADSYLYTVAQTDASGRNIDGGITYEINVFKNNTGQ